MKRLNRTRSYRVNLSDEERAALERLAWVDGVTLADELRKLVRDAAKLAGFWTDASTDDGPDALEDA